MESDFLVIGSGIAGLSFALRAAELGKVVVVTKKEKVDSATNLAQGGIAAVLSEDDSWKLHFKDTMDSGAGLCDPIVVERVVKDGTQRIKDLIDLGVDFVSNQQTGKLDLGKEGGHSARRVAHAYDLTGREIERALLDAVKKNRNIEMVENATAVDLLMDSEEENSQCNGAYVLKNEREVVPYTAKVTTICTGGSGKVYLYTSNPDISTGDGIAMAYRAGAEVANMEFVQFHPTCLYHPNAKNFLISEAVRGEGGKLVDGDNIRFMDKYDERGELATRDTVARAIDREMKERGLDCVYLNISHKDKEYLKERFPTIYSKCLSLGIDIAKDPIPVVPAAHYMCGGVVVDRCGKTSIENLYVLGESANTGLHGGNRLASNSLLEAVVYAKAAFEDCLKNKKKIKTKAIGKVDEWISGEAVDIQEEILINHNWDTIRRTMWNYVGIVRSEKRLILAKQRIIQILREVDQHYRDYHITINMVELRNICTIAILIIEAAMGRKESRGLHYMIEYTEKKPDLRHWKIYKRETGQDYWCMKKNREYQIIETTRLGSK